MTDMFHITHATPRGQRERELRKRMEAEIAADEQRERASDHLSALRREREAKLVRIARLREHAEAVYVIRDDTGLAPGAGLILGGTLGDLLPAEEETLAEIDRQIAEREAAIAEQERASSTID